jgi:hypothetical protein
MYIMVKVSGDIIFNVQNNVRCKISNIITKKLHNNPWSSIVVQKYILAPIYRQVNENLFRLSIQKINYEKRY